MYNDKSEYWRVHYEALHAEAPIRGGAHSLDYSNEQCQAQTYSHVLEAAGSLRGRSLLDVGCGLGMSSRIFQSSGANVLGVDIVEPTISALKVQHPEVQWACLDITDKEALASLPCFDVIVAMEVLQLAGLSLVTDLWKHIAPGGRLVGSVPNKECPLVQGAVAKYPGMWAPISSREIAEVASALPNIRAIQMKGMSFRQEQWLLPYSVTDWSDDIVGYPNRIVFVLAAAVSSLPLL